MQRLLLLSTALLCGCGASNLRRTVEYLTSDALQGRAAGSEGEMKAAQYVMEEFARVGVRIRSPRPFGRGVNVVGVVPGALEESVVIGAHLDHLGVRDGAIYRGADDNASGVVALIELAGRFARRPARRTVVLCGFGAEEAGILGSREYVKSPIRPFVAMVNLDMVGRMVEDRLICIGTDTSDVWERHLAESNRSGLKLTFAKGGVGPSDHTSFYQAGVPVLHFFTGAHRDYHQPTDTADKLNFNGIDRVVDLVEGVVRRVADAEQKPAWRHTTAALSAEIPVPAGALPYLGAMPDYAYSDRMVVADVAAGSPAEKAGVKAGDVILAIEGAIVEGLEDYSKRFFACRPGQAVTLVLQRAGREITVRAVLGAKGGR